MIQRIVIYGVVVPEDQFGQKGSGSLVDLTYFVESDFPVSVSDIFGIIESAGYHLFPKRVGGRYSPVEQDKVTVERWDQHLKDVKVGIEQNPPGPTGAVP